MAFLEYLNFTTYLIIFRRFLWKFVKINETAFQLVLFDIVDKEDIWNESTFLDAMYVYVFLYQMQNIVPIPKSECLR